MKHFIDLDQISAIELRKIVDLAKDLKSNKNNLKLENKNLAMIFEKSSTRTRISFEAGINQLGGHAIVMNKNDTQLGKGETIEDTAKVLSRLVDLVMIRSDLHQTIVDLSNNATIPVINALSDFSHPCQILASILAIEENIGDIKNKVLTWYGDANNVLNSYIHASEKFGYELRIVTPSDYDFCDEEIIKAQKNGAKIFLYSNAELSESRKKSGLKLSGDIPQSAEKSDVLISDTWISMGQSSEKNEVEREEKLNKLMPFQVTQKLMDLANKNAVFTHCLPAYRGYEVESEVIDGNKSIIFDEAENRLHAQKAIMLWCCNKI